MWMEGQPAGSCGASQALGLRGHSYAFRHGRLHQGRASAQRPLRTNTQRKPSPHRLELHTQRHLCARTGPGPSLLPEAGRPGRRSGKLPLAHRALTPARITAPASLSPSPASPEQHSCWEPPLPYGLQCQGHRVHRPAGRGGTHASSECQPRAKGSGLVVQTENSKHHARNWQKETAPSRRRQPTAPLVLSGNHRCL